MIVVYDVEQFKNFHCLFALDIGTGKTYYFEISDFQDDRIPYIKFLESVKGMIGFNNIDYDQHMVEFIKNNHDKPAGELARLAFKHGQKVIRNEIRKGRMSIPPQCDIFRIMHYNNKAKATSLKSLQFAMRWKTLQDLPYKFDESLSLDMRDNIKGYVENDVRSTYEFYKKISHKIVLRNELKKQYKINCLNWDDSKIGEQIVLAEVNRKRKHPKYIRSSFKDEVIKLKDIIIPFDYKNEEIIKEKKRFESLFLRRDEFKGTIANRIIINGFPFKYGAGGIHGSTHAGTYKSNDTEIIMSSDVSSYYPNLAVSKKFYINQCGPEYIDVIDDLYQRKESLENGHERDTVKLALVSVFGKSNDLYSPLLDPYYFLKTTINGQLFLTELSATLLKQGFKQLLCNTDGIEFIVPRDKKHIYLEICDEWCEKTGLLLEHNTYKSLALKDENNYLGVFSDGSVKKKGMFVTDKDWHNDHSFLIIPKAIEKYIVNGIKPEDYISNHDDIFDFCGEVKAIGAFNLELHRLKGDKLDVKQLQRTNRVFISNRGGSLYKRKDDRVISVYKGLKITLFNNYYEGDYDINRGWYISEAKKWIDVIEPKQISLF